jgi:hypothetical protein
LGAQVREHRQYAAVLLKRASSRGDGTESTGARTGSNSGKAWSQGERAPLPRIMNFLTKGQNYSDVK